MDGIEIVVYTVIGVGAVFVAVLLAWPKAQGSTLFSARVGRGGSFGRAP